MKVVSLVPSVTETLSAWGCEPAACTRFCERPDLMHVGGTKSPDIAAIVALGPDLVVVDREENRREDVVELRARGIQVLVLHVDSLGGLAGEMAKLAASVGVRPPAPDGAVGAPLGVRVFVPIWRRPWMTIGGVTYGSTLLAALGVENVFADVDGSYPRVTLDDARALRPDLVLVPSEPYDFRDTHVDELGMVAPAIRVDGRDLFWWGARTAAAAQRLHDVIARIAG